MFMGNIYIYSFIQQFMTGATFYDWATCFKFRDSVISLSV